jgi:acetoin utilization deacetylase AcuC-like enzyme
MDVYNPKIKKVSHKKLGRVNVAQAVSEQDTDESYVSKCQYKANEAMSTFYPDFVIYIAGYDCLKGDKYGKMSITEGGVIARDECIM